MVGRTISHYQITDKLGSGGMGEIYRAQDTKLTRTVAIKALSASHAGDDERRRRFLQEARAASALNHPNIITIHDIVTEEHTEFLVMEFVDGKTLADLIPPAGLSVSDTLSYAVQMADALSAAHAAGIVHRDLKPGNVMVTRGGLVKILDFGLAKLSTYAATGLCDATATLGGAPLTVEGSIMGTVSYMSPEQAEGRSVDARSDIFSFGVVLYEMTTGRRAFSGDSALSVLTAILRDDVQPFSDSTAHVPPRLEQLVRRCLTKNPAARWQTMPEVRDALAALKRDAESTILAPAPVIPKRTSSGVWIAIAAAVVIAGFAGWWTLGRHRSPTVPASTPTPSVASAPPVAEAQGKPKPSQEVAKPTAEAAAVPAAPAARTIAIPDGLPLSVQLAEDIPSDAEPGLPLRFTVLRDFQIDGVTVVAANAEARGEVVDGAKKKLIGGSKVTLRITQVAAVDGRKLSLRTSGSRRDADNRRSVDVSGMAKHARDIAAPAGTEYVAYTAGEQTVAIRK